MRPVRRLSISTPVLPLPVTHCHISDHGAYTVAEVFLQMK
jgi:hypothetical protein